jgi:hypothetical protein
MKKPLDHLEDQQAQSKKDQEKSIEMGTEKKIKKLNTKFVASSPTNTFRPCHKCIPWQPCPSPPRWRRLSCTIRDKSSCQRHSSSRVVTCSFPPPELPNAAGRLS